MSKPLFSAEENQAIDLIGPGMNEVRVEPEKPWSDTGFVAFSFRLSRTLQFHDSTRGGVWVQCPLFELRLEEMEEAVALDLSLHHDGSLTPEEEKEITRGDLLWAFLKGGYWYDFAVAWDAPAGRFDVYLNGILQEELRIRRSSPSWPLPGARSGPLIIHCRPGDRDAFELEVRDLEIWHHAPADSEIFQSRSGKGEIPLSGEGRCEYSGGLDLADYRLEQLYEADFTKPLALVHEKELFQGEERTRVPECEWILEGPGDACTRDGRCVVESVPPAFGNALVLWCNRPFPNNVLIEFTMEPKDSSKGLGIVFFATRSLQGDSPFALSLPKRDGGFGRYHSGALSGYHVSYWSANSRPGKILRRTSNLRKNRGFVLCSVGNDRIGGSAPGPHQVRILHCRGLIEVEVNGQIVLSWKDDGTFFGPAHSGGWIGLRQMGSAERIAYSEFRVSEVVPIRPEAGS